MEDVTRTQPHRQIDAERLELEPMEPIAKGLPQTGELADTTDMSTLSISLPDGLKAFVDERVAGAGYQSRDEYIRDLIRIDRDRERLRWLLLEGAASPPTEPVDEPYYAELRARARNSSE